MKKCRTIVLQIALLLIVSIASVTVAIDENTVTASADVESSQTVILDTGHGGLTNITD